MEIAAAGEQYPTAHLVIAFTICCVCEFIYIDYINIVIVAVAVVAAVVVTSFAALYYQILYV